MQKLLNSWWGSGVLAIIGLVLIFVTTEIRKQQLFACLEEHGLFSELCRPGVDWLSLAAFVAFAVLAAPLMFQFHALGRASVQDGQASDVE